MCDESAVVDGRALIATSLLELARSAAFRASVRLCTSSYCSHLLRGLFSYHLDLHLLLHWYWHWYIFLRDGRACEKADKSCRFDHPPPAGVCGVCTSLVATGDSTTSTITGLIIQPTALTATTPASHSCNAARCRVEPAVLSRW